MMAYTFCIIIHMNPVCFSQQRLPIWKFELDCMVNDLPGHLCIYTYVANS